MKLTLTQRLLRPIINVLVERFFPGGAFYGHDFLKSFERAEIDYAPTATSAAGALLISKMSEKYYTECVVKVENITLRGEPVGSWKLTVEKIEGDDDAE